MQIWMRNKDVIAYLGLWEKLNNENFKGTNLRPLKIQLEITVVHMQEFERLKRNKFYQHKVDLTNVSPEFLSTTISSLT